MSFDLWIALVLASLAINFVPGPALLLVASKAALDGQANARLAIFGVILGDTILLAAAFAGIVSVFVVSAALFSALKIIGALYLVWIGVLYWRKKPIAADGSHVAPSSGQRSFWTAVGVAALNPKVIAFHIAFFPQFIRIEEPLLPQLLILGTTFLVGAYLALVFAAVLGNQATRFLTTGRSRRTIERGFGTLMIGAGGALLSSSR